MICMFDAVLSIVGANCIKMNGSAKVVHYLNRSSPLLSAEAAFRRLGCSHLGTLRQCDFRFNAHRTGETACIFAGAALLRMQSFCCSCTQTRSCSTHKRLTHKHPSSERCFLPTYALTSRAFKDKAVKPSSLRAAAFRRLAFY